MANNILFNHLRARCDTLFRYYLRSIVFANPSLSGWIKRVINHTPENQSSDFWDSQLAGPWSSYLEGTISIHAREALITALLYYSIPGAQSFLDIGCAGGSLALNLFQCSKFGKNIKRYIGVDISKYAIERAKKEFVEGRGMNGVGFYACDLREFTPEDNFTFDIIVFNEILYQLDVHEAAIQVERYSNWLQPNGLLCISMKNDPKSKAIYRTILKRFQLVLSVLFQIQPDTVKYRVTINREHPAFVTSIFRLNNNDIVGDKTGNEM